MSVQSITPPNQPCCCGWWVEAACVLTSSAARVWTVSVTLARLSLFLAVAMLRFRGSMIIVVVCGSLASVLL